MLAKMGRIALIAEEMGRLEDARMVAARLAEASQVLNKRPQLYWCRGRDRLLGCKKQGDAWCGLVSSSYRKLPSDRIGVRKFFPGQCLENPGRVPMSERISRGRCSRDLPNIGVSKIIALAAIFETSAREKTVTHLCNHSHLQEL